MAQSYSAQISALGWTNGKSVRQDILHGGEVRELLAVHVWHVSLDVIPVVMPIRALDAVQVYIY